MPENVPVSDAYASAGVDTAEADRGVGALARVLGAIDPGRPPLSLPLPGHYASVLRVAADLGIALATDSVGSKVIVAQQVGRFDTIGIDCVAMNVNDLICVGAEPLALLDYVAVERAETELLEQLAVGLRAGAEAAGVEIPGGEVCQLPEVIRGHPSPYGFDLVGSAFGTVALDRLIDGGACVPGDVVIGLPSSGLHANGLTLARRVLLDEGAMAVDSRPQALGGRSVGEELIAPTTIYVRAALELLRSEIPVHGLAHITGGGVLNLLRIGTGVGYELTAPLPVPPIFELISEGGSVSRAEMWEVFNMGCGFCVMVAPDDATTTVALLDAHHPGAAVIGNVTEEAARITLPKLGLAGDAGGLRPA
jgi:phosphoribosylformylglycinamidine cyclo-ligase